MNAAQHYQTAEQLLSQAIDTNATGDQYIDRDELLAALVHGVLAIGAEMGIPQTSAAATTTGKVMTAVMNPDGSDSGQTILTDGPA